MLAGKQGAGKTANSALVTKICTDLGYTVFNVKFADPLYTLHKVCLPYLKSWGCRPGAMQKDGELLQVLGTEYGRKYLGEDVWVKVCRRFVDADLADPNALVIIDDARFENEFDAFPDAFRVLLECERDVRKGRASYWRDNETHPSECGLDNYRMKGKFDLVVNTRHASKESVSHLIRVEWFNDRSFAYGNNDRTNLERNANGASSISIPIGAAVNDNVIGELK